MEEEILFCLSGVGSGADAVPTHTIRRLTENDCGIFNRHLSLCGQEKRAVREEEWRAWYRGGTEYFLLFADGLPVARCAIERYSVDRWEAADVRCAPGYRNRGFAAELTAYVTKIILESGRTATCRTLPENLAMLKVIRRVGYVPMQPDD